MYPFIPQFLWREQLGLHLILRALAADLSEAFLLVNELFNFARTVAESPVPHADDRKEWGLARRVVPHPVLRHIQPLSDILCREERVSLTAIERFLLLVRGYPPELVDR
jgi:hypothetical protein